MRPRARRAPRPRRTGSAPRRIATFAGVVLVVFGVTFAAARWTRPAAPARTQLALAPVPATAPLEVRTLAVAAKLPALRRPSPAAAAGGRPETLAVAPLPSSAAPPAAAVPRPAVRDYGRHARAALPLPVDTGGTPAP
jgi:hypothetical protein